VEEVLLLYAYVPQSSQVHRTDGVVFARTRATFARWTTNTSANFHAHKSNYYSEERISPRLQLTDFKPGLLDKVRALLRVRRADHPWLLLSDEELLCSLGL
jgi:ATP-dependent DNA helicase RecG